MSEALDKYIFNPRYNKDILPIGEHSIKSLIDDVIMGEYADLDAEGNIKRPGSSLFLPDDASTQMWRLLRVLKVGPNVKTVAEGDIVIISNTEGLKGLDINKRKLVFMSENRHVFAVLEEEAAK